MAFGCKSTYVGFMAGVIVCATIPVYAGVTQVGDFRLTSGAVGSTAVYYNSFSFTTRSASGAPVQILSTFTGTSQNYDTSAPDSATDIGLRTYTSATQVVQLSRYVAAAGTPRVGAVQWSFNLSGLGSYLTTNNLALTALDLAAILKATIPSGSTVSSTYDVYLSYTNAAEGITLGGISTTSGDDNYTNIWAPAQSSSVGSIVSGGYKILALQETSTSANTIDTISADLLALYNSGVTQFNLIIASGDYWAGRNLEIESGSGISITTAPVPEPTSLASLTLAGGLLLCRRRHAR